MNIKTNELIVFAVILLVALINETAIKYGLAIITFLPSLILVYLVMLKMFPKEK